VTVDVGLNLLTGLSGTPFAGTANGHIEVIPCSIGIRLPLRVLRGRKSP
jgi:hypothetical protein